MIPDDSDHRKMLTEQNGYREGFLVDTTHQHTATTILTIQDRETGEHVQVEGVNVPSLYGANRAMLHESVVEELDSVYNPTPLGSELVAKRMLVDPERTEGLRFVYHESFFTDE